MNRWLPFLLIGSLLITSAANAVEPVAVQYGKDPKQSLNVYRPDKEAKSEALPVVIWVHGGGWRNGDKDNQAGINLCQSWANSGLVTVGLDYRLTPAVVHPAHVEDVAAGIDWVHNNISKYGGDPKRVFLLGHSAGAHLVALVATAPSFLQAHELSPKSTLAGVFAIDTASYDLTATRTAAQERRRRNAQRKCHVEAMLPPFCPQFRLVRHTTISSRRRKSL